MEEITKILKTKLKLKDPVKSEELSLNIWLLKNNMKPCVLLDFCQVQPKQFNNIAKEILGENGMLLKLGSDYLLCNWECLFTHLSNIMTSPPVILDITTRKPFKILENYPESILNFIQHLRQVIVEKPSTFIDFSDINEEINLCTIFGILLDFPVVYYFQTDKEMTSLNNEDLTVVSLQFISRKVTSYSVPRSVYLHSTRIQQSVQNWVTRLCPGIIFDLSEINSRKVIKICDKDFCLVKENVNLPYVAL